MYLFNWTCLVLGLLSCWDGRSWHIFLLSPSSTDFIVWLYVLTLQLELYEQYLHLLETEVENHLVMTSALQIFSRKLTISIICFHSTVGWFQSHLYKHCKLTHLQSQHAVLHWQLYVTLSCFISDTFTITLWWTIIVRTRNEKFHGDSGPLTNTPVYIRSMFLLCVQIKASGSKWSDIVIVEKKVQSINKNISVKVKIN